MGVSPLNISSTGAHVRLDLSLETSMSSNLHVLSPPKPTSWADELARRAGPTSWVDGLRYTNNAAGVQMASLKTSPGNLHRLAVDGKQ